MTGIAWFKPNRHEMLTPSVILLLMANLVPLYGVISLHWQVFPIVVLFWIENAIVGIFNVFRMLLASPGSAGSWLVKIVMIPFFCFHYGMFTLIHGVFVFGFFGGYFTAGASFPDELALYQTISNAQLGWAILALLLSHTASFILNYIGKGEYKKANLQQLMGQPYNRVVLLHITILVGGFFVMSLGSPVYALLILILLKISIDIQAHIREHKKYALKHELVVTK